MKEIEFNLLDEPWIRVRDDSCQVHEVIFVAFSNLQTLLRQSSSSRQFLLSLPVGIQLRLHERSQFIHTQQELRRHAAFLQQVQRLYSVFP